MTGKQAGIACETAGKLDLRREGVKLRSALFFLVLSMTLSACSRPVRPMPEELAPGDWATYMGAPARTLGANSDAPADPVIAWRAEVGRGLMSPMIVSGPALVVATGNRMVAAISTESGEHYWERRLDGPPTGGVLWRDGLLYASIEEGDGELYALNARTGKKVWERDVGSAPHAPRLWGDTLFMGTDDGWIVALVSRRQERGERIWRTRVSGSIASAPEVADGRVYVTTTRDSIYALESATGRILLRQALPETVGGQPALRGDTLAIPLNDGTLLALRLPALEELWRAQMGAPIGAAPVIADDGYTYVLNRHAEVWRVNTGSGWPERIAALGGAAHRSLALTRNGILVGRLDGSAFLLRRDGSTVWEREFDDAIVAPMTAADGAVYVPLLRGMIVKLQ